MSDDIQQEDVNETNDVVKKYDGRERVALELFQFVYEQASGMPEDMTSRDLIVLYSQCYNATQGFDPDDIFDEE